MSLLVTGSIGIDTIETPHGRAENVLGGSAVYFSLAAALFTQVRMVGVVGEDFDQAWLAPLTDRRICTRGVEGRPGSRTFRWHGRYQGAMNEAETVDVKLNVLGERGAKLPEEYRDSRFVFLANSHPALQRDFVGQLHGADLVVMDTMNLWITTEGQELRRTMEAVHGIVLNEGEARLLTLKTNLYSAGRDILRMGPKFCIIKKGEHGALLVSNDDVFIMPAYPTEKVIDPTGAGDSFAGGMMGYLAHVARFDRDALRAAIARGTVAASFVIESFSVEASAKTTPDQVHQRLGELSRMVQFD